MVAFVVLAACAGGDDDAATPDRVDAAGTTTTIAATNATTADTSPTDTSPTETAPTAGRFDRPGSTAPDRDPARPRPTLPATTTPVDDPATVADGGWVAPPPPDRVGGADSTPVLVTVFSHNERTRMRFDRFRTDPAAYAEWRQAMIDVVRLFARYGVRYSWQTDFVILEAIQNFEAKALADDPTATDGLPIVTWMADEMGVSIEPHAHECITPPAVGDCGDQPYNYADVAALIEEVTGHVPAPVIGGTSAAERTIDDFAECLEGNVFDAVWCPSVLIGFAGAEGGHATDDNHSGVWRPSGFADADFLVHDSDGALVNIGRGYSLGLFSTDGLAISQVHPLDFVTGLADRLERGEAERGKVYTATLNFNEDALVDDDLYDDIEAVLEVLAPLAADGRIVYANFPETVAAWDAWYGSEPNIYAYLG